MDSNENFQQIIQNIWATMLDQELSQITDGALNFAPDDMISACIRITGDAACALVMQCTKSYALRASSTLFDMSAAEVTMSEIKDAIGELVNNIGGNYKALFHGTSKLSLPQVFEGKETAYIENNEQLTNTLNMDNQGEGLLFKIYKAKN